MSTAAPGSLRVVLLAPIDNSIYSLCIASRILREPGLELAAILVRRAASWRRVRQEFAREGVWLLRKVWRKLFVGDYFGSVGDRVPTLASAARAEGVSVGTLSDLGRAAGVPVHVVGELNDPGAVRAAAVAAPDVLVFSGGGLIRQELLGVPRLGTINCHPGILPAYRGMDVIEWAVLEHEAPAPWLGLTAYFMDRGVDTGPLLAQVHVGHEPGDDLLTLRARFDEPAVSLHLHALRLLRDGSGAATPQQPADGRQYFQLHPRLRDVAESRMAQLAGSN